MKQKINYSLSSFLKKITPIFQFLVKLIVLLSIPILIIWICRFKYSPSDYSEWKKTHLVDIPKGWHLDPDIVTKEIGMPYLRIGNKEEIIKNPSGVIYKNFYYDFRGTQLELKRDLVFIPNSSNNLCSNTKIFVKNIDGFFYRDGRNFRLQVENSSVNFLWEETQEKNFFSQWVPVFLYLIIYFWIYLSISEIVWKKYLKAVSNKGFDIFNFIFMMNFI